MRRGLAVVALAAVLAAGCGTLTAANGPLPPPDAPWPTTGTLSVFLCSRYGADVCKGREASPEQRRAIQQALLTIPGIKDVRFETQEEAWKRFREKFAENSDLLAAARKSDMPESFIGSFTSMKDDQITHLERLPGAAMVVLNRTDFWVDKADVGVNLCPSKPSSESSRCKGRGAATTAERDGVFQALSGLGGVRTIYLEPRDHGAENMSRILGPRTHNVLGPQTTDAKSLVEMAGESFHLVIEWPEIVEQVKRAVEALPGVEKVVEHR